MPQRLLSVFDLTEDQAIALLKTPPEQLDDPADRYIAASQLAKYSSDRSIKALLAAIEMPVTDLNSRIVRRKAVETLGYLNAKTAVSILSRCLQDEDPYTVQNAVWSLGEIGTQDTAILAAIAQLLNQPTQNHRLIIQTLAKLDYGPAVEDIHTFSQAEDPAVASAAIAAIYQLTGDLSQIGRVIDFLQHESVNVRRSCIQDLVDAQQYGAISQIARCPVSMAFRLRGVRLLAEAGIPTQAISFPQIAPPLEQVIRDHPDDLELIHQYDQPPSLEFLLNELYETDFARCYLATKTILAGYPHESPMALIQEYNHKAQGDYGAHYHVIKLFGWLRYGPAYEILITALHNPAPQFQKSRTAAAIALGQLGDPQAIADLKSCLNSPFWVLNYACLMALQAFNEPLNVSVMEEPSDLLVRSKWLQLTAQEGA
ncbi:MAG: phycocyanin operon protein Y [Leptolyngbya sp. SIOISBB]|nr:phycocyanin operon protein Y [Leptolyngbya sp. SIOISBB]